MRAPGVTSPSDVSRRAKVTANWGSPYGRRAGNPGPGRCQPGVRPRDGSGPQVGVAGASGGAARQWRLRLVHPGGAGRRQRRKRRRAYAIDVCRSAAGAGESRPGLRSQGMGVVQGTTDTAWNAVIRSVQRRNDGGRVRCTRRPSKGYEALRLYVGDGQYGKEGGARTCPRSFGRTPHATMRGGRFGADCT